MAIFRAPRPQGNFYILDKRISEDRALSWGARGLLVFLLGKPDNWNVSIANLIDQTADCRLNSGRDAVRAFLREISEAGYMTKKPCHGSDGKFSGYDYLVSEVKISPEDTMTDFTATDKAATANHPLTSIESLKRIEEEQNPPASRPIGTAKNSKTQTLSSYIESCATEGKKVIPEDHYIRQWAKTAGIDNEMMAVAWAAFREDHVVGGRSTKRYKDWPMAFANSVKGGWYRLWFIPANGAAEWTSQGRAAQRNLESITTT